MAKCPKCSTRKGKRFCPALATEICPRCCGEHRLKTIRCPPDCPFLDAVSYQKERRQEKATAHGKEFLAAMHERFPDREAFYFATQVQAEVYAFSKQFGSLDDAVVAKGLRDLKGLLSKIYVPEGAPHPLALFILHHLDHSPRYKAISPAFSSRDRLAVIDELVRYAGSLGGNSVSRGATYNYEIAAFSFYDNIDLIEDFHFQKTDLEFPQAPGREPAPEDGPFRRTAGGLILPS